MKLILEHIQMYVTFFVNKVSLDCIKFMDFWIFSKKDL